MYSGTGEIRLHLSLYSEALSPAQISAELGVLFDKSHALGDKRGNTERLWEKNHWQISERVTVPFSELYDALEPVLDRLLLRVEKNAAIFLKLATNDVAVLALVIECDGYPGIGLSPESIRRLARLGVSIDIDLYCDPRKDASDE